MSFSLNLTLKEGDHYEVDENRTRYRSTRRVLHDVLWGGLRNRLGVRSRQQGGKRDQGRRARGRQEGGRTADQQEPGREELFFQAEDDSIELRLERHPQEPEGSEDHRGEERFLQGRRHLRQDRSGPGRQESEPEQPENRQGPHGVDQEGQLVGLERCRRRGRQSRADGQDSIVSSRDLNVKKGHPERGGPFYS